MLYKIKEKVNKGDEWNVVCSTIGCDTTTTTEDIYRLKNLNNPNIILSSCEFHLDEEYIQIASIFWNDSETTNIHKFNFIKEVIIEELEENEDAKDLLKEIGKTTSLRQLIDVVDDLHEYTDNIILGDVHFIDKEK